MKKIKYFSWAIVAFVAINFTACEDEPTDASPEEQEIENPADEGQFVATIAGEEFEAETAAGVMTPENELFISGLKSTTGQEIELSISNAAVGNFALTTGSSSSNFGRYIDGVINTFPYTSAESLGGSGIMQITAINTDSLTITGTFNFIGGRPMVDVEGNPILDGNGDPVIENIQITEGAFNAIPYTIEDDGGGGGSTDPEDEFFAIVDGVDFIADSIQVTEPIIGGIEMIKVEARNSQGALIRIDVPRNLGVGTFAMENISDGTKLIALYNDGLGGENLTSNPGTITITEFDLELGVLKATFAFTGTDPLGIDPTVVEVTEGSFTAVFVGVPGATTAFLATVDGASYVPETITITQSVLNGIPNLTIITTMGDQSMGLTFPLIIEEEIEYEMGPVFENGDEKVGSYNPMVGTSITYVSNPGTLIITNYDIPGGIIEGTFVFTAVDATGMDETIFEVTNGSFLAVIE